LSPISFFRRNNKDMDTEKKHEEEEEEEEENEEEENEEEEDLEGEMDWSSCLKCGDPAMTRNNQEETFRVFASLTMEEEDISDYISAPRCLPCLHKDILEKEREQEEEKAKKKATEEAKEAEKWKRVRRERHYKLVEADCKKAGISKEEFKKTAECGHRFPKCLRGECRHSCCQK
jgi:hypothetical protein